jgi:hypothetical protein
MLMLTGSQRKGRDLYEKPFLGALKWTRKLCDFQAGSGENGGAVMA